MNEYLEELKKALDEFDEEMQRIANEFVKGIIEILENEDTNK